MLRDDHSNYIWLFPFSDTSAGNAAHAMIDSCAPFTLSNGFMPDGPTHFRNDTIRLVSKRLKVPHHCRLPYTPWSNGAVGRLGKEFIQVFRSIVSDLQMYLQEWPIICNNYYR